MPEYEYATKRFCPSGANDRLPETVEIPDAAVGVSLSTWGSPSSEHDEGAFVKVSYLIPADHAEEDDD